MSTPEFFNGVRPHFGGRLNQFQVDGMNRICHYGRLWGYSREHLAYILATVKHETGSWMQPIREGAHRVGPEYSDLSAKAAVRQIHAKGLIRENYALPAGPYGQSYYGRGLVQITWYENYQKFAAILAIPLDEHPDLALEWDVALDILFLGMRDGMFTGKKLSDFDLPAQFKQARVIVNGDSHRKWGGTDRIDDRLAASAGVFWRALAGLYSAPDPVRDQPPPEPAEAPVAPAPERPEPAWRRILTAWRD